MDISAKDIYEEMKEGLEQSRKRDAGGQLGENLFWGIDIGSEGRDHSVTVIWEKDDDGMMKIVDCYEVQHGNHP